MGAWGYGMRENDSALDAVAMIPPMAGIGGRPFPDKMIPDADYPLNSQEILGLRGGNG